MAVNRVAAIGERPLGCWLDQPAASQHVGWGLYPLGEQRMLDGASRIRKRIPVMSAAAEI